MNPASHKLATDVKAVAGDVRELVQATAERSAESIVSAREKVLGTLASLQACISAAPHAAMDKARATARATDDYVHDAPWPIIGAAALVGAAIGFLLARR